MTGKPPTGKIGRALSGGRTVAKVGGQVMTYYAKRPFLSRSGRSQARDRVARQGAQTLFQGLSLLRGTALKMAQQLSLEMDLLPEAACRELAKAYHQVPPLNRALVRQVVRQGLGRPPEAAYKHFDLNAFAAASLGQVHHALGPQDTPLAVKIQYPGIAETIESDVGLLRQLLRPLVHGAHLIPSLNEVAQRLHEEVDYLQEAANLRYFAGHLNMQGIQIPEVMDHLTAPTVLSMGLMPGKTLDAWLMDQPDQEARDHVAQKLNDLVIKGLYELNVIHADPNPGNFIIDEDLSIGLVDFGCIKRLEPEFVTQYGHLARSAAHHEDEEHFAHMVTMGFIPPDLEQEAMDEIKAITRDAGRWFSRLFAESRFDFGAAPDFMADGKAVMRRCHHLRRNLRLNPEVIFLDRTRYGLWRIFEMMGARVRFRNPYEW